jgi:hypothetical protein
MQRFEKGDRVAHQVTVVLQKDKYGKPSVTEKQWIFGAVHRTSYTMKYTGEPVFIVHFDNGERANVRASALLNEDEIRFQQALKGI